MLTLMTVEQKKAKDKRRKKTSKKIGVKKMKNITKKTIITLSILGFAGSGAIVPVKANQTIKASYYQVYAPNKSYYIFKASSNKKLIGLQYKNDIIESVKVKKGQYYKVYFKDDDMTSYKAFKPSTSDFKKFNARYITITKGDK